jgi:hypothetical protein
MLLPDLVRLVHMHADEMVEELAESLRADPHVPYLRIIGDEELRQRVVEVYRHCAEWAAARVNQVGRADAFERGYTELGRLRRTEQVPASQVVYALIRAKEHLVDFVKRNAAVDNSVEMYQESELEGVIHGFFDRAIYYVLRGYERADEEKG